jgi:4-hydroxy-tetrahydrodipicolinate synthase
MNQMIEVISRLGRVKPNFCVLSGDDALTLPLIAAGGDGVISVVSNLAPAIVTELCETCLKGDFEKAREIHYRLMPFFKAAFVDGNPTSIKYAMKLKGLPSGGMRLPLVEVTTRQKKLSKKHLKSVIYKNQLT